MAEKKRKVVRFLPGILILMGVMILSLPGGIALGQDRAPSLSMPPGTWPAVMRAWSWLYPTPTPEGYKTPTPTPTPTPKMVSSAWIPPEELFAAFGPGSRQVPGGESIFGRVSGKKEVTITYPDRTVVEYDLYQKEAYDPHSKTLSYSLLMEAYRLVYWDMFGIALTTPTPAPTAPPVATPTPEDYKTPVPTPTNPPTPSPSPTPESPPTPTPESMLSPTPESMLSPTQTPYCDNNPLEFSDLEDMSIAFTRATTGAGWVFRITRAIDPGEGVGYGYVYDMRNIFEDWSSYSSQAVAIRIYKSEQNYSTQTGDYITLTYDTNQTVNVYPPAHFNESEPVYYFIDSNGSTYSDEWLCELAKAAPTATPVDYKTPTPANSPTPTPTTSPTVTPTITPAPLMISDLGDLWIANRRSQVLNGWQYSVTTTWEPGTDIFGTIDDYANAFNDQSAFTVTTESALQITYINESVIIEDGDWIAFTYNGFRAINVYPPPLSGNVDVYYYIGSDGATYLDAGLSQLAKAVPTPVGTGGSRRLTSITPVPSASPRRKTARPATPAPAPSPSPDLIAGPGTFDLVDTLSVGSPVWSVWADDRYLYGGAGDGRVYIWQRSPAGFSFQGLVGGYTAGNIYGVSGFRESSRRRLYGASQDGSVYAWEYDVREDAFSLLAVLDQGGGFMYSVAGDGEIICGANNDGRIYCWTAAGFSLQTVLDEGLGPMLSVCLDDDYIYGANADGALYLWDRETFAPANAFSEGTEIMWSTTVDSSYCYGGSSSPAAAVWEKGSFILQTALGEPSGPIGSLSSDDRRYLYGAGPDGALQVWKIADFSPRTVLDASALSMNGVFADRYLPGDSFTHYIYGASGDGNIYLWLAERTPTPTPTPTFPPTPTPIPSATPAGYRTPTPPSTPSPTPEGFHTPSPPATPRPSRTPEGFITPTPAPSPTFGTRILLYPTPSPSPPEFTLLAVLSRGKGWMLSVYADRDYIYGANQDKYVYIWDRTSYRPVTALSVPDCKEMLSVYADDNYIYGSNEDSRVYVWDRRNFSLLHVLGDGQYYAESVFADGDYLYGANYDRSLYVWNRSDFSLQSKLDGAGGWLNSVYADNGRIYAGSGGANYSVYLWNRSTFDLEKTLTGPTDDLNAVRADGDYIYGASADSNLYLWDYTDLYLKKILAEPLNQVTAVISSGSFIYGSSLDQGIYIWEKPGLDLYGVIDEIKQPMQWVYVDGTQIFGASRDGNIYVWQAPAGVTGKGSAAVTPTPPPAATTLPNWVPGATPSGGTTASETGAGEAFPVLAPTPPVYELKAGPERYDPHNKTIDYPLLQETYKKVYLDFFNILLTTPTPPPTPVPSATGFATPTPEGYKTPAPSGAGDVVINEIAWRGTNQSTDQQWIELYNYGSSTVSLDGWTLKNNTSLWQIDISGSYSVSAGGYFVLATAPDPTGGKVSYSYDSAKLMTSGGNNLELVNATGSAVDTVNCSSGWAAGEQGVSMERIDPEVDGCTAANWNGAPSSKIYGSGSYGTPGAKNSQQKSVSSASGSSAYGAQARSSGLSGASAVEPNLTLRDYADWIDFLNGHYFKLYEWELSKVDKKYALYDYLPNTAFIYLVTGYKPTGAYFKENLLAIIRDKKFDWGGEEHCRYIADIAESYLAMLGEGFFNKEERGEIEEKLYGLAIKQRDFYNYGNYAQGIICGLNAVVGYIVGGKRGEEMINWANRLLSYDDTWTLPENSRHYQGLFIREMLRVALYSNRMTIPDIDAWGVAWKANFIRQIEWIIDTFPHNGFNPAYGRDYRQNYVDHFIAPLAVATSVLDDGHPDHIRLAREAKWLLQKMFAYGTTHTVSAFGQNDYGYEARQWGPFAILLNPLYLYWYLNEDIQPERPGDNHPGSRAVYRPMMPRTMIASVYDENLKALKTQPDKIIHRTGWEEDALFLMLDPAYPAAKSGDNKYSFANNIISLSYGPEEFLTGVTMNFFNPGKTKNNLADILGSYIGAELVSWVNDNAISRSVTRLKDGKNTWTREITLYKTGDRRIEVKDILSRRGSVYWHFQGNPQWQSNGVVLDVDGTRLKVTWEGAEQTVHRDRTSWSDPDPAHRWCYSGNPDREVKLYRSIPGTITTTFRGL